MMLKQRTMVQLFLRMSPMSQETDHFSVEKRILVAMRKTLSSVVRDATPSSSALKSPLSEATIEDIKMCFGLIAAREQEIAKKAGVALNERPQYPDSAQKSNVVSLDSLKSNLQGSNSKNDNSEGDNNGDK